jgi:hypothetical protein
MPRGAAGLGPSLLCYEQLLDAQVDRLAGFTWPELHEDLPCGLCYTSGGRPMGEGCWEGRGVQRDAQGPQLLGAALGAGGGGHVSRAALLYKSHRRARPALPPTPPARHHGQPQGRDVHPPQQHAARHDHGHARRPGAGLRLDDAHDRAHGGGAGGRGSLGGVLGGGERGWRGLRGGLCHPPVRVAGSEKLFLIPQSLPAPSTPCPRQFHANSWGIAFAGAPRGGGGGEPGSARLGLLSLLILVPPGCASKPSPPHGLPLPRALRPSVPPRGRPHGRRAPRAAGPPPGRRERVPPAGGARMHHQRGRCAHCPGGGGVRRGGGDCAERMLRFPAGLQHATQSCRRPPPRTDPDPGPGPVTHPTPRQCRRCGPTCWRTWSSTSCASAG